jgi:osmoprotectant transport system substrate-binding protein/osmoprotectant transport system permease protein
MAASSLFDQALAHLPDYLGSHVLVSMTALALGLLISLPLAFASLKRPWLRASLLSVTSIVQTIPGLALLALFYPLLLGLAALCERMLGFGFSAFGFLPAVLALTLYSMLPVVRNTIAGLTSVAPALKEAALGVGMTEGQSLRLVELPLALPVIMAGVRTAAVWVIGTATLSTPIGQTSLGNYIFTGLQTQNWVFVLFGCFAAAALALVIDQLLALIERGLAARRQRAIVVGAAGLAAIVLASLLPNALATRAHYVIGAKTFAEQYALASAIQKRLGRHGLSASLRTGLGSAVVFDALAAGDIDVYVDYSGTLWTNQMHRTDSQPRDVLLRELESWLSTKRGVKLLGAVGFENAYGLAMTRKSADALGVTSIGDLTSHAARLSIAGDYEFFGRPEWIAVKEAYGLSFASRRQMQGEFMYGAIGAGDVDVISAFTSDGRIAKLGLIVLDDPKQVIPPYDAIILVSPSAAKDEAFLAALSTLIGAVDIETMREANLRMTDGASAANVGQWLEGRSAGN